MKLRFLGTGTSFGIPVIGCGCAACSSDDPRDRRTRHGALLSFDNGSTLLVDTPTELRLQLLNAGTRQLDAVWFTHSHADHTHGIDDLRIFCDRQEKKLPVYADQACARFLRHKFDYIFDESYTPVGGPKVNLDLRVFDGSRPVDVCGQQLIPLALPHGDTVVYGFRVGDLGYVTDAKELSADVRAALRGIKLLVLNALWFGRSHPTHFNIDEAVQVAADLGVQRTYLTHLTHRVTHQELLAKLPPFVRPAYDGLEVEL